MRSYPNLLDKKDPIFGVGENVEGYSVGITGREKFSDSRAINRPESGIEGGGMIPIPFGQTHQV